METTLTPTAQWLQEELQFINTEMAHTLNGRLKGEFVSCDDARQEIVLRYPLDTWMVNGLGTLHGGMINTMMDLVMSMAVYAYARETIPPTVSMTTNYLRPVSMGDYVEICARVTSLGKRNATAYCEARIPASMKLACTAVGTYAVIPKKG